MALIVSADARLDAAHIEPHIELICSPYGKATGFMKDGEPTGTL